jgi:nicotinate-nucleotide adenylyltransferase
MGGTFDPIHFGHLVTAEEALVQFNLDRVLFMPTGMPALKVREHVTPAEDRYLMTVLATASNPDFDVSRMEVDRPGLTFTVDTLRALRDVHGPSARLFFITGADALASIASWRDSAEVLGLAHFVGVTRPGHVLTDHGLPQGSVTLVEVPALAISSTDCRDRVAAGAPIRYLVPDGVHEYVAKRGLYREAVA